jgi:hypothetical protein
MTGLVRRNMNKIFLSTMDCRLDLLCHPKASLDGDLMALLLMHPYFKNSAEEFHPYKTFSTLMKFLSSLSSSIRCHINLFNAHKTLMKPH